MKGPPVAPMFIYVSGPYSAPASLDPEGRQAKVASNVEIANSLGLKLAEMGHIPFVPHTMMSGWEDAGGLGRERAMNVCHRWVDQCDALFYIASSSGADSERERAVALGIPVYRELKDIPVVNPDLPPVLSADARDALLTEYRECMASYRHTYATIWQAGGIFTAISAAVVALSAKLTLGEAGAGKPDLLALLAPIPFLFWWWGIFRPMNRYGEWRNDRLVEIEDELSWREGATRFPRRRAGEPHRDGPCAESASRPARGAGIEFLRARNTEYASKRYFWYTSVPSSSSARLRRVAVVVRRAHYARLRGRHPEPCGGPIHPRRKGGPR